MKEETLYKYLDIKGGKLMLENSNLQYTNATKFNDPFDCHPSLIDFSNVPPDMCKAWDAEVIQLLRSSKFRKLSEKAWICCLSKVYDSLLMWSYYTNNHKGICIGLNMENVKKYLHNMLGQIVHTKAIEVSYTDILCRPDYFYEYKDYQKYLLCTKAKAWVHEQEKRLIIQEPYYVNKGQCFYPTIGKECFESLYLGIKIDEEDKNAIIELARKLNPDIKIFQMQPDPEAFRLVPEEL
jgi:hypothetical protein